MRFRPHELFLGVFLTVAVFAIGFVSSPIPQPKAQQEQKTAKSSEEISPKSSADERVADYTLAVAWLTGVLAFSTIGLWVVTWRSGNRQSKDMEAAVIETRRIGEAQTRAYVDIREASVTFIGIPGLLNVGSKEAQPVIQVTAKNTGQSPARNFVWNPTVRYLAFVDPFGNPTKRTMALGGNWRDILGVGISVGHDHTDRAMVTDMLLLKFLRESRSETNKYMLMQLRIQFEFTDVFDNRIVEEAFFSSSIISASHDASDPIPPNLGDGEWEGRTFQLRRLHKTSDWTDIQTTEDT
jgi:hypothetical protein